VHDFNAVLTTTKIYRAAGCTQYYLLQVSCNRRALVLTNFWTDSRKVFRLAGRS